MIYGFFKPISKNGLKLILKENYLKKDQTIHASFGNNRISK